MSTPSPDALLAEVQDALTATAAEVVPAFLAQVPHAWFHDTDPATRRLHLAALVGAQAAGVPPSVTLRSDDGRIVTAIRPDDRPGLLAELLAELPRDKALSAAKVYTAHDGLVLDVFEFGEPDRYDPTDAALRAKRDATVARATEHAPELDEAAIDAWLNRCSAVFVSNLSPRRLVRFARLYDAVVGTEHVAVDAWLRSDDPTHATLTVAAGRAGARRLFERMAQRLGHHGLTVDRAYLDPLRGPDRDDVVLASFVVRNPDGRPVDLAGPRWTSLLADLKRVRWLDERVLGCAADHPDLGLQRAELVVALLDLAHVRLARIDPFAWSRERMARLARGSMPLTSAIVGSLVDGPLDHDPLSGVRLGADTRRLLETLTEAVAAIRHHNLDRDDRYGLLLDLEPSWLLGSDQPAVPHAVVYGHGAGYRGFHVRFRPIARGGLRVVAPRALDRHTLETERVFDEAYGLAFAQQLKNKDIPEGGAKGVLLVHPEGDVDHAVRAFADGLLDLALQTGELLYLGPDENITPAHIDWITQRAAQRGYAQPLAFMSSKPGAGINHKEYGVTSEGVVVFLDALLRDHGIDPRSQPIRVVLTGGPDGDVAGNAIRILHREYGERVRVVGIADGSGCAEDPDGLHMPELLRMVSTSAPIAAFDRTRLGPRGQVVDLSHPDGPHLRDTLHTRLSADVFVPAGGRPRTVHQGNWHDLLDEHGAPKVPAIVEGANLFLTAEARTGLSEAGMRIVKDSSANKCGVICSSYEIAACMLLDEAGFLSIKERYVEEVLELLRGYAADEARALLVAQRRHPERDLPSLSVEISRAILATTDAIVAALPEVDADDRATLDALVLARLPHVLIEAVGPGLLERLPAAYVDQTIACSAASNLIYREGFDVVRGLDAPALAALALRWIDADREVSALADALERGDPVDARRAAALLRAGGARAAALS